MSMKTFWNGVVPAQNHAVADEAGVEGRVSR